MCTLTAVQDLGSDREIATAMVEQPGLGLPRSAIAAALKRVGLGRPLALNQEYRPTATATTGGSQLAN
jgi:hypothetical protein